MYSDENDDRVLSGVDSCLKARFDSDYVHLSEPIAEACSEVKTRGFFEWSKMILFDLIRSIK